MDAFDQNRRLGRGVNIIGYDPLWKDFSKGRMKTEHFRLIRAAGFDHVRINLHPFKFMGAESDFSLPVSWLEALDWAVTQCLNNQMIAILDLHEYIALAKDPLDKQPKLLAAWQQIPLRYQTLSNDVFFELLNEPNGVLTPELWNNYLIAPYNLIRQNNPDHTLIIGPAWWNGYDYLDRLVLPEDDRNIIVTVHYYHPMPFTHQGAPWSEFKSTTGIHWTGTPAEQQVILQHLTGVQAWAQQHRRPIYLGEFGAYEKGDMASRASYTAFMARQAEQLGWSWGYWQFDSDFILYNIDENEWVQPLLEALIPTQV